MIVHELRNPLTTIGMGLTALQSSDLSARDQMRLSLAAEEQQRIKKLLNEILDYAKPQLLETSAINLKRLTQEVVKTLREQPELSDRHLIVNPTPSNSSDLTVNGDRNKLKQVLINLISNACEAVEAGETGSITLINNLDHIHINIHNGGAPIPADILPRLTHPFFSTKPSGNGLGLAIVNRIVEAHQGKLSFQSATALGTTATVRLPLAK